MQRLAGNELKLTGLDLCDGVQITSLKEANDSGLRHIMSAVCNVREKLVCTSKLAV